jgi:hypothetical protein
MTTIPFAHSIPTPEDQMYKSTKVIRASVQIENNITENAVQEQIKTMMNNQPIRISLRVDKDAKIAQIIQ